VADRLVLSKADLATAEAIAGLEARLAALNPGAPRLRAEHGRVDPAELLGCGLFGVTGKHPDVAAWLRDEALAAREPAGHDHHRHDHDDHHDHHDHQDHDHHDHDLNRHDDRIAAFCLTFDDPLDWNALIAGLELLAASRGADLLRLKGIVNARDCETPLALHGVQHVFHPPSLLPAWPVDSATGTEDHRTRLVFITRDLGQEAVRRVLDAVLSTNPES